MAGAPEMVRLCVVGKAGVGKRTLVSLYGQRSDPNYGGSVDGTLQVSNTVTCQVRLNSAPVTVRLNALSDWADAEQFANLLRSHRILMAYDMSEDAHFAGAGDLHRLIMQAAGARGTRPTFAIVGTKADLCRADSASMALSQAAPFLSKAARFAVSTADGGDSILRAVNSVVLSVHAEMIARGSADAGGRRKSSAARGVHGACADCPAEPPCAPRLSPPPEAAAVRRRLSTADEDDSAEERRRAAAMCLSGAEQLQLERQLDLPDPELDHPIQCPALACCVV